MSTTNEIKSQIAKEISLLMYAERLAMEFASKLTYDASNVVIEQLDKEIRAIKLKIEKLANTIAEDAALEVLKSKLQSD